MQTSKYFLKAKKSLGQHFLRSEKAINVVVDNIKDLESPVFEIGPGEGVLTEKLLQKGFTVYAIEVDKRSVEILKEKFAKNISEKKLFIINNDCLEVDCVNEIHNTSNLTQNKNTPPPQSLPLRGPTPSSAEYPSVVSTEQTCNTNCSYTLVGNIPYYITGAIFRHTFEQKVLPTQVIFLIQKEVAERIVARDKKESLLSVSIKIFSFQVRILDIVKAGSFVPAPKVDSAIISIENVDNPFAKGVSGAQETFFKILRAGFSHKRKFFLSNLKTDLEKDLYDKYFEKIKPLVPEKVRPEDIGLGIWLEIVHLIQ
jgi:16S rRNA (adenine1518-N6/adenine1519-N6)-dimethyltransferase